MTTVVLLQGVNVGGRRVAMAVLRDALADASGTTVRSHGQAGNLIADLSPRGDLHGWLGEVLSAAAGFAITVVTRSVADLAGVVERNPYPGAAGNRLHITFLSAEPSVDPLDEIDLAGFAPEQATVAGREVYLHLPNGMGRSPLASVLARRAPRDVVATTRNWNTVTALAGMAAP